MKKDFEFIKEILTHIENNKAPVFYTIDLAKEIFGEKFQDKVNIDYLYNHIQLLGDAECVTCMIQSESVLQKSYGFRVRVVKGNLSNSKMYELDHQISTIIKYDHKPLRLTNAGYDLLTSLSNNQVMEEIKKQGGKIAIDSIVGIASSIGGAMLTNVIGL